MYVMKRARILRSVEIIMSLNDFCEIFTGHKPLIYVCSNDCAGFDCVLDVYDEGGSSNDAIRGLVGDIIYFSLNLENTQYAPKNFLQEKFAKAIVEDVVIFSDVWFVFIDVREENEGS